ncbi:MAG: transglutaminase domain-containing protein [Candidatus Taylorbacteria bacterium]
MIRYFAFHKIIRRLRRLIEKVILYCLVLSLLTSPTAQVLAYQGDLSLRSPIQEDTRAFSELLNELQAGDESLAPGVTTSDVPANVVNEPSPLEQPQAHVSNGTSTATNAESTPTPTPTPTPSSTPTPTPSSSPTSTPTPAPSPTATPSAESSAPATEEAVATTTEEIIPQNAKFKKNSNLSIEDELKAVREHLVRNILPQVALDRLTAFEEQLKKGPEEKGLLGKAYDFVMGNSDEEKEKAEAERLIKQEPFKVETFEGEINTAPADRYERDFSQAKEQGNMFKKIEKIFQNGTSFNSNFDKTKKEGGVLTWIFGSGEAIADASNNPNDYLAPGGEITFSQALQDEANLLGKDPLTMLNFVRNNIEYVPYYGSKKGSSPTLIERAGNDMDQSSLLIAMLRYSGIPARYRQVDAKMDISTVTDLLGVDSAISAAQILSLEKIPYTLYTQNGEPFFVVEHTYVEAYIPYGYSRGADMKDGGTKQWVAMDPSVNSYYFERFADVVDILNTNGFTIEKFFDDYLNGNYPSMEPLGAFKSEVTRYLASHSPEYYPDLNYDDALMRSYTNVQNLEFIPGSLPYKISADLNTYDYIPSALRHSIKFTMQNDSNNNEVLNYTAYVSDLADKELLIAYDAATPNDQTIIDSFDTIYDVVPLSIVNVKPKIKINGNAVATGGTPTSMGQKQKYSLEFKVPVRSIGGAITENISDTVDNKLTTGNTEAIALNTDRVVPREIRPKADTQSSSFISNQILHESSLNYLDSLQYTQQELSAIMGADFTHIATQAAVSNGLAITYSNGQPYSFDWKGLRIDSSSTVRYFNRFGDTINAHKKEFIALFGLQASQDESDIFEDNFNVESVATVKGLKLVSSGRFPGVTMRKITKANESDIDSLNISASTKSAFHSAIGDGRSIYTPTAPITYGQWQGLFYITIDFAGGGGTYAIGEGLNGGYTVEVFSNAAQNWLRHHTGYVDAIIISPSNNQSFTKPADIQWEVFYTAHPFGLGIYTWTDKKTISSENIEKGLVVFSAGYGAPQKVTVKIKEKRLGDLYPGFDKLFFKYGLKNDIPPDLLKSMAYQESCCTYSDVLKQSIFDAKAYRYEAHKDYDWYSGPSATAAARIKSHPERHFAVGGTAIHGSVEQGDQVPSKSQYLEWSKRMSGYQDGFDISADEDGNLTAQELLDKNPDRFWVLYKDPGEDWNFTAQLLLASSYGILQAMYETALTRLVLADLEKRRPATDPAEKPQDAVPIINLFDPDLSIKIGANYLKIKYNINDEDWWSALRDYNGGGKGAESYADAVISRWNNKEGIFKEIIE